MDIPVLQNTTVEPGQKPDAYNTLHPTAVDFGGIQGAALSKLGQDAQDIAMVHKQRADSLAVTDAMNKLSDSTNKILSDPETGLLNLRGKDSLQVPQKFKDQYEEAVGGIQANLTNGDQQSAFAQMAAGERRYSTMRIDQHVSQEMQQFTNQTYAAAVSNAQSLAIQSNGDPAIIAGALNRIGAVTRAQATAEGWPPETTTYMLQKAQGELHMGVIQGLLTAGSSKQAQLYYDHVKDDIPGQEQDKIQQALKVGVIRTEATVQANQIIKDHPNDLKAQNDAARNIDDPMLHDEVVRQITQNDDINQKAKEEQHHSDLDTANAIIASGKGFNSLPPALVTRLSPSEADAYRKYANTLSSGVEPPQNWGKWTDFVQQFGKDPVGVAKLNLMTSVRPYVDNEHYNQAVEMQKAAIQASQGDKEKLTALQDPQQRFDSTVFPVAFPSQKSPAELTGDDKTRYGKLASDVQSDISAQEQRLGRKLTPDELQKTMDDFVHEQVFVHGWFSNTQKSRAAITQDEEGNAFVPLAQVPKERVTSIQNFVQSQGGKISDDKIERIYAAAILGDDDEILNIAKEP